MKSSFPFIVQWSEGAPQKRFSWWLKGVEPNLYVGETTDHARKKQTSLEGVFAEADLAALEPMIQDMLSRRCQSATIAEGDGYALLALGTRSRPDILFRYATDSEATDESARLFLRIVETLQKYVEPSLTPAKSA